MGKTQQNKITGFGAIIFGLVMIFFMIPNWVVTSDTLNLTSPDTFPRFAAGMLIILGVALLLKTYIEEHAYKRKIADQEPVVISKVRQPRKTFNLQQFLKSESFCVVATFLVIALFSLLLEPIGYLASSFLCCTLLLIAYRCKKWYYYVTTILFTVFLYYVFGIVLHVRIP